MRTVWCIGTDGANIQNQYLKLIVFLGYLRKKKNRVVRECWFSWLVEFSRLLIHSIRWFSRLIDLFNSLIQLTCEIQSTRRISWHIGFVDSSIQLNSNESSIKLIRRIQSTRWFSLLVEFSRFVDSVDSSNLVDSSIYSTSYLSWLVEFIQLEDSVDLSIS